MESYWCMKKNSIINWILYCEDLPLALTPCRKAECDQWEGGECIQIRNAGKPDKLQVGSKEVPWYPGTRHPGRGRPCIGKPDRQSGFHFNPVTIHIYWFKNSFGEILFFWSRQFRNQDVQENGQFLPINIRKWQERTKEIVGPDEGLRFTFENRSIQLRCKDGHYAIHHDRWLPLPETGLLCRRIDRWPKIQKTPCPPCLGEALRVGLLYIDDFHCSGDEPNRFIPFSPEPDVLILS